MARCINTNMGKRGRPVGWIDKRNIQRDRDILGEYYQTASLRKVGKKFGLTRERIRQIIGQFGVVPRIYNETLKKNQDKQLSQLDAGLVVKIVSNGGVANIKSELKLNDRAKSVVWKSLSKALQRESKVNFRSKINHKPAISKEQYVKNLQEASKILGLSFSHTSFSNFARENGWPGGQTAFYLFGSWISAMKAAGLTSRIRRRASYTKIDQNICILALTKLWVKLGYAPTTQEYDGLRDPGDPCCATLRNRVSRKWVDCLKIAKPSNV